jgi:glycosyltransferase involved in cell wall biosynthesis
MTDASAVCVLIPVFNDQVGITRTLEALARDPFPYDIVIVDDGSRNAIECTERCGNHVVKLLRLKSNRGIEHALNAGLEHLLCSGYKYVARLDAGDLPEHHRIAQQMHFLDQHSDVGIVGTWARCVDDDGNYLFTLRFPTDHAAIIKKQRYAPALLHPTVMIRTAALIEVGLYSAQYKTAEDYDLFIRISKKFRIANIPEVLTQYIVSTNGTTVTKRRQTLIARFRIQRENFSWLDPHCYFGIAQTGLLMVLPFELLITVKRRLWK